MTCKISDDLECSTSKFLLHTLSISVKGMNMFTVDTPLFNRFTEIELDHGLLSVTDIFCHILRLLNIWPTHMEIKPSRLPRCRH